EEVVVEVVGRAAARLADGGPIRPPDVEDVVARDRVGERLARVAGETGARARRKARARGRPRLQRRVVEHIAPASAVAVLVSGLEHGAAVVAIRRALAQLAAPGVDVAEEVDRPVVRDRGGDADGGAVDPVRPDAHVAVAALGLDAVVPGALHHVAVDVAVGAREAVLALVVLAADRIVEVALRIVGDDLVEADHVVPAAVAERDPLRPGRMAERPAVRAVARVVDAVALDHDALGLALPPAAARADAGVEVHAELPVLAHRLAIAAPAADVVVLDDDVVRALAQHDGVARRAANHE